MNRGWIRLYRKSFDNKFYFEEPFTKWQAWIDLLLLAAYEDRTFYVRGHPVRLKKGEIAQSTRVLRKRWKWSRAKVIRYLRGLEMEGKVRPQKSNVINRIQIVNFQLYQQTIPLTSPQNPQNESTDESLGESTDESTVIRSKEVKERLKKRIKTIEESFEKFWKIYPRKAKKSKAFEYFKKINPNEDLFKKIMRAVETMKDDPEWIREEGKYIPHPSTWLNNKRWLDCEGGEEEEKAEEDMIDIMKRGSKPK